MNLDFLKTYLAIQNYTNQEIEQIKMASRQNEIECNLKLLLTDDEYFLLSDKINRYLNIIYTSRLSGISVNNINKLINKGINPNYFVYVFNITKSDLSTLNEVIEKYLDEN